MIKVDISGDMLLIIFDDFCREYNIIGIVDNRLTLDRPREYLSTKLIDIGLEQHELDIFIDLVKKSYNINKCHITLKKNISVAILIRRLITAIKRNKKNV